jgi:hypothetical protein
MAFLLYETTSASAAQDIVEAVVAGELWGYSNFGTTTKVSSYSDYVLIELTESRSMELSDYKPDNVNEIMWSKNENSFSDADANEKLWYLRAKL